MYIFQGRRLAAEQWSGDNAKNFFEKLYRLGMCELMHTAPLLGRSQLGESNTEGLKSIEITYKTMGILIRGYHSISIVIHSSNFSNIKS